MQSRPAVGASICACIAWAGVMPGVFESKDAERRQGPLAATRALVATGAKREVFDALKELRCQMPE